MKNWNSKQHEEALKEKLLEECNEYFESKGVEELVDIAEVILVHLKVKGIILDEFESMRSSQNIEKGSFDNQIFLVCAEE